MINYSKFYASLWLKLCFLQNTSLILKSFCMKSLHEWLAKTNKKFFFQKLNYYKGQKEEIESLYGDLNYYLFIVTSM